MYLMSGPSEIMVDEQLLCRQYGTVLGQDVQIVDGKRQYAAPQEFTFIGNVQPVTGDDLILTPEGDRFNEQLFVYVQNNQLQVPDTDSLVFRTWWYQVQMCETWGSYTRYRIQRVDVGPDRALGI